MDFALEAVFARQDQLITRRQALEHMTEDEIASRLGSRWRVVFPGVYASSTDSLTRGQRVRAALLHAGAAAMLNDVSALRAHRVPYVPEDERVRVLVPSTVQRLSRDFVVVRRTTRPPIPVVIGGFPVAPVIRALCEFGARHDDPRQVLAVIAAAVQRRQVALVDLLNEAQDGPARGRPRLLRAIEPVLAGIRSAPEQDFRMLVGGSRALPEPLWNSLLQLPDGRRFSPDALFPDAALIHETNGREFHAAAESSVPTDPFEDMQRRGDALVAAGFTVLHNSPRRLLTQGREVLAEVERCYRRDAGRGLPPGVVLLESRGVDGAVPAA